MTHPIIHPLAALLNPGVRELEISGIRRFSTLAAQYPDALSLTLGQPDFATPEHVKQAGCQAIADNHTVYTANAGLLKLRQAAADFVAARYDLHYDANTEVIITNGATQALDIALRTLLVPGSEVVLPGPVYPGYEPLVRLAGATPVFVDTRSSGFRLTAQALKQALTARTRCVLLPYPSNPTGTLLGTDELAEIAAVLAEREVFVVSDEIYSELVYTDSHHSLAQFANLRNSTVVINGLSKSHAMTGWRIGFTFAPPYITEQMLKVHQYSAACASSVSQYAALEALTHGQADAAPMREAYLQRRDLVCARLRAMGLPVTVPAGAFYVFPDISEFNLSSFAFAARLLAEVRLAVVPGAAFSPLGEGHVRISYAYAPEVLTAGMDRLESFLTRLRT
ncbi:aminotransferase A [Alicyclobacillaceae bacterium I2511]|nr:aminotransferase A [Alicyclobacillaceae bacterium I2511]